MRILNKRAKNISYLCYVISLVKSFAGHAKLTKRGYILTGRGRGAYMEGTGEKSLSNKTLMTVITYS